MKKKSVTRPLIPFSEFAAVAASCNIAEEEVDDVSDFLHNTGTIVRIGSLLRREESGSVSKGPLTSQLDLEDFVVMDAQFIVDLLSSVVTFSHRYASNGKRSKEVLKSLNFAFR